MNRHPSLFRICYMLGLLLAAEVYSFERPSSFINVRSRNEFLRVNGVKRADVNGTYYKTDLSFTPEPPVGELSIPHFRKDPAGWKVASRPLIALEEAAAELAAYYLITLEEKYSNKLISILESWAVKGALLDYSFSSGGGQTWVNISWTISSVALSYSIIKSQNNISQKKRTLIEEWLVKVANKQVYHLGSARSCCNNLLNWRALQAASVGLVARNKKLTHWSVRAFKKAIASLDSNGAFIYEMKHKKSRALNYQNFAIWPLVYVAKITKRAGLNLFEFKHDGPSLVDAIKFFFASVKNPQLIAKKNGFSQDLSFLTKDGKFNWLELVEADYPGLIPADFLCRRRPIKHRYGGYSTLYFARNVQSHRQRCGASRYLHSLALY